MIKLPIISKSNNKPARLIRIVLLLICFLHLSSPLTLAKKQKLALPNNKTEIINRKSQQKKEPATRLITADLDSIEFGEVADRISFTGYDKQAGANYETFFITNSSDKSVTRLSIEIEYQTLENRTLDKRTATVETHLPPGQTRKADVRSWDRQKSFYFYRSRRPRNSATPYKVIFKIVEIGIKD